MQPGTHYDTKHTACPCADKTSARLLFSIAAANGWPIENMDIKKGYVHERAKFKEPIYVREIKRSDNTYPHEQRLGVFMKNLWGGKSAVYYYITFLLELLVKEVYNPTQEDGCALREKERHFTNNSGSKRRLFPPDGKCHQIN